jgi:3-deoxy-D-manno-octulosonic-acid transferase
LNAQQREYPLKDPESTRGATGADTRATGGRDPLLLLYNLLLAAVAPLFLLKGGRKHLKTFRERMGRLPDTLDPEGRPSIWIHAVSVGEVLAARTLIAPLKQRFRERAIFLSTTTLTGNAIARQSAAHADGLFFAPFDWPGPVRSALGRLQPELLVLLETELWPNLIREARRRGTRIALVNGRISPRSFARYRRIRWFMRPVLADVDLFLMQEPAHVRRIVEMGAPAERVRALGSLKYDAVEEPQTPEALARLFDAGEAPIWVAGSTVEGEEELVLRAFSSIRQQEPDVRLVLAPRHPERFGAVAERVEAAGLGCVRRSRLGSASWSGGEVLLLDTLGELAQVYPLATAVFVGGSLVPRGGHNILEPAIAGRAVIVGPHMENFQQIADDFLEAGGLIQIGSPDALAPTVLRLLNDAAHRNDVGNRARALIERNRGALDETVAALEALVR